MDLVAGSSGDGADAFAVDIELGEAAVPVDEELEAEIRAQQRRVVERWTLTLIGTAQASGQTRMTEMNKQVMANLDRMIGELLASNDDSPEAADAG